MWKTYKIELDKDEFFNDLNLMKKDMNKYARKMMAKVFQDIRREAKTTISGQILNKVSGNLMKSIKYKAKTDFTGSIGSYTVYSSLHERGGTILPKKGEYLYFKIDGELKRARQVVIPQRQFLWPKVSDYFGTDKAEKVMDSVLQKALDDLFND